MEKNLRLSLKIEKTSTIQTKIVNNRGRAGVTILEGILPLIHHNDESLGEFPRPIKVDLINGHSFCMMYVGS